MQSWNLGTSEPPHLKISRRSFYYEYIYINIKKLQSTFKKSCYRPCSHRSKTAKSKGKGAEKGIAEIVHLMKPITRSPDSSSSCCCCSGSSSSSSSSNSSNK
jgi:hypothetical protein